MRFEEARFSHDGFDYILVERGRAPFAQGFLRLEPLDGYRAQAIVTRAITTQSASPDWRLLDLLGIEEHPYNLCTSALERLIEARFLGTHRPDLYRIAREPLAVRRPAATTDAPPLTATTLEAQPRSYVVVEVVSGTGAPLPGVRLALTAPDGSVHTLATGADGMARLEGIDPGTCAIVVPAIDMRRWEADGGAATRVRTEPGRMHVVQPGECLALLAHRNGIADWRELWDHPENAGLKAKRKSPHVLLPGDSVALPGIDVGQLERSTDATHRITVTGSAAEVELVLVLRDHEGDALAGEAYELTFVHEGRSQKRSGQLSGSGELRESVPVAVRSADLFLTALGIHRRLAVGRLDPIKDEGAAPVQTGVLARLIALGHGSRKAGGGPHADLRAAVRSFQELVMGIRDPTGELDEATCTKLEEAYGV